MVSRTPGTLRIIGGRWRGRKVLFRDAATLRPTPNRVRETLFNWLDPVIAGAACLDLFAGSGILALEALSRGAGRVTLIDHSRDAIRDIERQLAELSGTPRAEQVRLVHADALSWLRAPATAGKRGFAVVFVDPPFGERLGPRCCQLLAAGDWLAPDALIYVESAHPLVPEELPDGWRIHRQKRASQVHYCLCRAVGKAGVAPVN